MRIRVFYWLIPTIFLLNACGTGPFISTSEAEPAVSVLDPVSESAISNLVTPYGKNIRFEQISLEEGLSQSIVNAILQDRTGFLWVGTDDGLNRYDGYTFVTYKPDLNNPNSLSDHSITALVEDEQGFLWIGTRQGGLNRYNPSNDTFTRYTHEKENLNSISSNLVYSLCLDKNGLWIGTDSGLDHFNFATGNFTHYNAFEDLPSSEGKLSSNNISALYKDSKDQLWIGTNNGGLNLYDPLNSTFKALKSDRSNPQTISGNRILSITEGVDGSIWVGTTNGLNQFIPEKGIFKRYENSKFKEDGIAGNIVYSLEVDRSGGLWVGTNKGLDRFDPETEKFFHHENQPGISKSLSNNQILSIYEDTSGVLWLGTFGGGLNKYNRQQDRFAYYRHNPNDTNSLSSNFVLAILAEEDVAWIGTLDNGLNRFNPATESFIHYKSNPAIPASLSSNTINELYKDSNGILWVGTSTALDRYDPVLNRFTHYTPIQEDELESPVFSVSAIYEDSSSQMWVGSNQGLFRFNKTNNTFTKFHLGNSDGNHPDGYPITAILEDAHHVVWVGTFDGGLSSIELESGNVTRYQYDPNATTSIGNNLILCLYEDSKGTLWVGTHGGGLSRFDPETKSFQNFTENDGLPNNVIYGILEDEAGNLWISTNFGLARFNPQDGIFRNFTASDGLQSNEFNQSAFSKDGNGVMYFGGINGLNIFKPNEIIDNPYPPKISLTSITTDGNPLESAETPEYMQTITVEWPHESFEFEFTAFAYEQPDKNQYAYILEGFDPGWIEIGTRRNGRYTNLPGGTYTLRLRGSNSDGIWNEIAEPITVVVIPPFWETWWFGGLLILIFGVSVAGGLRWRVKSIEARNQELERLVRNRTIDLEKKNSEIEALYQADEKLIRSVTTNHIFQTLVNVSVSMLNADRSVIFTWNELKQKIMPQISLGFQPPSLEVMQYNHNEGMIGVAMNTGKPVIVSDFDTADLREDIKSMIKVEGIQSFAHFPIVVDERVVAIFTVAHTQPNALNKDSIRLFTALINRASMSIANMELFEQTRDLAVMEERNRLARDLHDSAKQKAFAALAQLGTVHGMAKAIPQGAEPHINEAENLVYEVIQELNFLIQEIYPIALQEKGLPTTLREYVFEWETRNDALVNLTIQNERSLPLELEQAVYRVIQEALANVSRHSHASRVDLSLVYAADLFQVNMEDNGCGFDMNQKAKGLGFRSMRERISSIRGSLQIQSTPGKGTHITIQIPIYKTNAGG